MTNSRAWLLRQLGARQEERFRRVTAAVTDSGEIEIISVLYVYGCGEGENIMLYVDSDDEAPSDDEVYRAADEWEATHEARILRAQVSEEASY